jgi:glutamine synthetase
MLHPVALYPDSGRRNGFLVMCEVHLPKDKGPHPSNTRALISDNDNRLWLGFEQEYFLMEDGRPLGFPTEGYPAPQGKYYTGVGYENVGAIARTLVESEYDAVVTGGGAALIPPMVVEAVMLLIVAAGLRTLSRPAPQAPQAP